MPDLDLADTIAGHLKTSRAHAYRLMEAALMERRHETSQGPERADLDEIKGLNIQRRELQAECEHLKTIIARSGVEAMRKVNAERERWRGFTAHCLRVVASLKAQMTAEQVVAHLDAEMDKSIARMMSSDSSDLDPDLVEWAARVLGPTVASSATSSL